MWIRLDLSSRAQLIMDRRVSSADDHKYASERYDSLMKYGL